mgnify:CR=1 FL=1
MMLKKSQTFMERFIKIILWIIFILLALLGLYSLINKLGI